MAEIVVIVFGIIGANVVIWGLVYFIAWVFDSCKTYHKSIKDLEKRVKRLEKEIKKAKV